jgi:hypothetical protein
VFQRRGGKGDAVGFFCKPLAINAMQRSGVPVRAKKGEDPTDSLNEPMVKSDQNTDERHNTIPHAPSPCFFATMAYA